MFAGGADELDAGDDLDMHDIAREGTRGAASTLPHLEAIQRAFGHHDVSDVRAFVGGAAETASTQMGAAAYASGDDVAFAATPDLRLAAHEAAHVVQQRGGVRLSGGVGREGDAYERHADAVADLVVSGQSAQGLLDQMAHRGASGGRAVQHHPGDRERRRAARRLRADLLRRRSELDSDATGRPESRIELERIHIDHALAELRGAGPIPSTELVERLGREHHDRVFAAALEGGPTVPDYRGDRGTSDHPDRPADDTPGMRATADDRAALRRVLSRRAADRAVSEGERSLARLALRDLESTPEGASPMDLDRIAELGGVAEEWGNEGEVTLPTGSSDSEPEEHETGTEVEVALDSVEVTVHDGHGGSVGAEAELEQGGGSLTISGESAGGTEMSGGAGLVFEHGADGITGADATLSAGYGAMSGELTGGATYYADRPQRQRDGTYRVHWRIAVRAGGEVSRRLGSSGPSIGGGISGELTREGTDVFRGATPEAALADARRFQESFRTLDVDTILERLQRVVTMDLGSVEWWTNQAPVGTERRVELQGAISGSLRGTVAGLLSIGAAPEIEVGAGGKVTKASETHVDVEQELEVNADSHVGVSAFGIGIDGLGMSGIPTEGSYKVTLTFRVELEAGVDAFRRFLAHERLLDGTEAGVRLTNHEVEEGLGEAAGVRMGPLGRIGGSEGTSTITSTEYDERGTATERTTHRARQEFTGNTVTGAYSHRELEVDAPESSGAYTATAHIHSTSGAESREMLGEETGTHGMSTDPATSSGHWVIREEMSQEQMREFHRRFIAHPASEMVPGTAYSRLYDRLRAIPIDATGDARRAEAITAFLSVEGRRGLQIIQSTGGFEAEQSLRLFGRDGEDTNFLGASALHEIEARIAEYRAAAGEHRLEGLGERIQADIDLLEPRLAAVADETRYTDLPGELRQRVCGRYSTLLDLLRSVFSMIDDTNAGDYSSETQGMYRLVSELRTEVTSTRADVSDVRECVLEHRRYYGQSPGRREGTLDASSFGRTEAAWSSAEGAFQAAETALREANDGLASVRGGSELDARREYEEARVAMERALHHYRVARDEMARLDAMYESVVTGAAAEADADGGTATATETAPTAADTATTATEPTTTTETTATETTTDTATGTTPRTERRRRRRAATGSTSDTRTGSSETAAADSGPRAGVVLARCLVPFLHREAVGAIGSRVSVDRGPARMPSGLSVELLGAQQIVVVNESMLEELGDRRVYNVTLRIVEVMPGATAFLTPQFDGMAINNDVVTNRVGQTFEAVIAW